MFFKNFQIGVIFILLGLVGSSCKESSPMGEDIPRDTPPKLVRTSTPKAKSTEASTAQPVDPLTTPQSSNYANLGYTHIRPDGNRFVHGRGNFPSAQALDIPLSGQPVWIVSVPSNEGSVWAVTLNDGRVQGFLLFNGEFKEVSLPPNEVIPDRPPLLSNLSDSPELLNIPDYEQSLTTNPVIIPDSGKRIFINTNGDLIILDKNDDHPIQLPINALPDARILRDEKNRLLLLTDPSTSYDHGVLGDGIEATSISLIEIQPHTQVIKKINIPENKVIEGISPIWADLNGDNTREIIVTLSDRQEGAQIAVYDESGETIALGPAIGQGYRWRHQIAVAPFGPGKEIELVDVLTPHIGGMVEFYRLIDSELAIVTQIEGFTSHVIGTRNLDMAAAGDFDGDGMVEILLPNQALTTLGAIQHRLNGAEIDWTLPIGGRIVTNLAAVTLSDGQILVGVGREDGILRIWHP